MPIVIAVIDDDEAVRDSTSAMLESCGYTVRTYENAAAFLLETGQKHDCLLVDHNMPGMSGMELIALLRKQQPATPALLITGQGTPTIASLAAAFGVPYLAKPVEDDVLLGHITQAVRRNQDPETSSASSL